MVLPHEAPRASTLRRPERALLAVAWVAAGLIVAGGLGPWLSHMLGFMLPAFALVRTTPSVREGPRLDVVSRT